MKIAYLAGVITILNQLSLAESEVDFCGDMDRTCLRGDFDSLACQCFTKYRCRKMCPPDHEFDPRKMCSCIPGEEVLQLYPKEAYPYVPKYLEKYLPVEKEKGCKESDLLEKCPNGLDFNTEHCMCMS